MKDRVGYLAWFCYEGEDDYDEEDNAWLPYLDKVDDASIGRIS